MSVAYELESFPCSSFSLPPMGAAAAGAPARRLDRPERALRVVPTGEPVALPPVHRHLAGVSVLHAPDDAATLRLTRRGVVVLSAVLAALAGALVWVAALSASEAAAPRVAGPAAVTVQPGDTLWSIAGRVAPGADPRAEIATLEQLNGIGSADLVPGQRLRLR